MEFGDIIYFILVVFFMILGFFNDSRKKKNKQKQAESSLPDTVFPQEIDYHDEYNDMREEEWKRKTPPPVPHATAQKPVHKGFQSSLDLVTDFEGESSLKGTIFASDFDFETIYNKEIKKEKTSYEVHPLVKDLLSDNGSEELKKGLIYGEILQRKY